MRIGSLFAGIGGLELGLEWAGVGRTVWQVERDPFCRAVLARHWPHATRYDDVRAVTGVNTETCGMDWDCQGCRPGILEPVDVLCGGFPCQNISSAGNREGINGAQSGLWRDFARLIFELEPLAVVIENSDALVSRGLDVVLADLDRIGYEAETTIVRASDVGAPHRRGRTFVVAHTTHDGREGCTTDDGASGALDEQRWGKPHGRRMALDGGGLGATTEPGLGRSYDGLPAGLDGHRWPALRGCQPGPGEPSRTQRGGEYRRERLHALGNAVVPQVAEVVGRLLLRRLDGALAR